MSVALEIVALGARTAVGASAESSAAAVRAGISRYREFPFIGRSGEPVVVAADPFLDPLLEGRERVLALASSVLDEVSAKLGARWRSMVARCRVLLVLPEARPGFSEADSAWILRALKEHFAGRGAPLRFELAGLGHAGALRAVETARAESARGSDELYLVLGADSYHHAATYLWLEGGRRFAQPGVRGGFTPGEAAGCFVLVNPRDRARLGLTALGSVRGVHTADETRLRDSATGSFGVGMSRAVHGALAGVPEGATIDTLYSDINGERYRSEEWGFVALRAPGRFGSHVYEAPADCWGDVGAASAPLLTILALQSFARRYARGPKALVLAGSDGGLRGAMLLEDPRTPLGAD